MTYKDIINDSTINNLYMKIKKESSKYKDHSIKHRDNVIFYCKKLIDLFEIPKEKANQILIAASLHDIGRSENNKDIKHAILSSIFAKNYLKDKLPEQEIDTICKMIELHSGIKERTLYQEILFFADKMDFTKNRLQDNYQEKLGKVSIMESINELLFEKENDYFILKILTNKTKNIEDLYEEMNKYKKYLEYYVSSIAEKNNLKYKIYWDEKLMYEGNKKIQLKEDN